MKDITAYIHEHIPLTAHLGAEVVAYDGDVIEISAPIKPNLNHRNTAFGGSISAMGILSGWALLFLKLKEQGIANRLVIQKSVSDFMEPIDGAFTARCESPGTDKWEAFVRTLKRHRRARISVQSSIHTATGSGGGAHRDLCCHPV